MGNNETKAKGKRLMVIILAFCFIAAVAVVVFLKSFELKNTEYEGNTRYDKASLDHLLMTEKTDNVTPFFWLRSKWKKNSSIPFIEKVDVEMTDRNSVKISVYEKLVTGCVEVRGSYLYFDRDGLVVESVGRRLEDIPLVTGLVFSKIVLGEKLEVQREEMFDTILNLVRLIEKNAIPVTEIHFTQDYSVVLYTEACEILLGKRDFYDETLAVLKSVLDSANGRKLRIDMTLYERGNDRITAQELEKSTEEE